MTEDEYTCALSVGDTVKVKGGFTRGRVTRCEWRLGPESEFQVTWPDGKSGWYFRGALVLVQRVCYEAALTALRDKLLSPSWNEVMAGDTVTFLFREKEYKTEAYRADMGGVAIMGVSTNSALVRAKYSLICIERPKPAPPTQPGSVIYLPRPGQFAHRTNDLDRLPWIADDGGRLTDRQVTEQGWEVAS